MENAEEIMQSLEEFSKMKPKDIPHELDDYLGYVAKTGDPVFKWSITKCLFREKLVSVITDFYESTLSIELPPCPNVDTFNYERMKANLLEKLDSFHGAPFTVQRISELLTNPRKEYNRADKFMRAIEKNILVVSTREPGRLAEGECENEPPYNGVPDGNDAVVETVFPCNDIVDQRFEVTTESVDSGFHVNVGYSSNSILTSTASPPRDAIQTAATSEEATNNPSTSHDTGSKSPVKENETVICSNVVSPQPVDNSKTEIDNDEPVVEEVASESNEVVDKPIVVETETESIVSSTLETTVEIVVPSVESAEVEVDCRSGEPSSAEEGDSSSSASPEAVASASTSTPVSSDVDNPASPKEPVEMPQEPESTVPTVPSQEEDEGLNSVPNEAADKEIIELRCSETAQFDEEPPVVSRSTDSNDEPASTSEENIVDEQQEEVKNVEASSSPAQSTEESPVVTVVSTSEDNEAVPSEEPMAENEAEVNEDQTRETSVIHTTSFEEPMEVDESLPSTNPSPDP